MPRFSSPLIFWVTLLCVAALLFVQLSGLHRHRHVELAPGSTGHPVVLHFGDAGFHGDHHGSGALFAQATHPPADEVHPHLDIESAALGDGLAKAIADGLALAMLAATAVFWPPLRTGSRRIRQRPLLRPPLRHGLRPPSHAPPSISSLA